MRSGTALAACCLALVAGSAMARTSPLRGVVEGYYGRPWSGDARRNVIRFLGARGMNAFVYGPKNDPYHRDRWRELYPDDELADLRATAAEARRARVRFVYAISPGLDICYSCSADLDALTTKLAQLAHARVRHFALFFDDGPSTLTQPDDVARYGGSDGAALARAHADVVNRVDRWLRRKGLHGLAFMIPSAYSGTTCLPYHTALAGALRRRLPVGWTGPGVFAPRLTGAEARARRDCLDGHPVILWDNFPVNDGVLSNTIHLGPLVGRDATLPGELAGYLLNPMTQAHASLVGLGTAAAYLKHPKRYDPESALRHALDDLDDSGGLAVLAEQTRDSPLSDPDYDDAHALAVALAGLEASWNGAEWMPVVDALEAEVRRQEAAPGTIATHLGDSPLGREIAPWVAELAAHAAQQLDAVRLLRGMKPTFASLTSDVNGTALAVSGRVAPPDVALVAALAPAVTGSSPRPDISEYVKCLGNLLGADIRLCTEFGLNVHGKAFYLVPFDITDVRLITGRNVHQRLVRFVAERHGDWLTRQQGAPAGLSLTLDDAPVAVGADGTFAVTTSLPAGGTARLTLATAAGDVTAVQVP
jgi:beta-N-acetylglucosaminidase